MAHHGQDQAQALGVAPEAAAAAASERGPLLLVVGMARSGTSALTELLTDLGGEPPTDLMVGDPWNERGYFESVALAQLNEDLLEACGGSFTAPPEPPEGWDQVGTEQQLDQARRRFDEVYPGSGMPVWKDPRLCHLLPFWRRALAGRAMAVAFIWREPMQVARSMRHIVRGVNAAYGDNEPVGVFARPLKAHGLTMNLAHGLALWETYNRAALAAMAGLPVLVTTYDELVSDPDAVSGRAAAWLADVFPGLELHGGRGASVSPTLRHFGTTGASDPPMASQLAVVAALESVGGAHRSFTPPDLGDDHGWARELLKAKWQLELEALARRTDPAGTPH